MMNARFHDDRRPDGAHGDIHGFPPCPEIACLVEARLAERWFFRGLGIQAEEQAPVHAKIVQVAARGVACDPEDGREGFKLSVNGDYDLGFGYHFPLSLPRRLYPSMTPPRKADSNAARIRTSNAEKASPKAHNPKAERASSISAPAYPCCDLRRDDGLQLILAQVHFREHFTVGNVGRRVR